MRKSGLFAAALAASLLASSLPSAAAALVASVDVASQTMTVSRYGKVIHVWKVSTARAGYVTPRGEWRPYRMHKMWLSRKYEMAPMPYAVFYNGGYAVHGTDAVRRLGTPASHGCVRLETRNAQTFYGLVSEVGPGNTRIVVSN